MSNKRNKKVNPNTAYSDFSKQAISVPELNEQYQAELDSNPEYSLVVDPINQYHFNDLNRRFIEMYVEYKNPYTVAELLKIDPDIAGNILIQPTVQSEIHRLTQARYHHQFAKNLISLDQIGGYLSSMLTDEFVPLGDRLKAGDKLKVTDMLIKLNMLKLQMFDKPEEYIYADVEKDIKEMSIKTIQKLLDSDNNGMKLTDDEQQTLATLSSKELLQLVEDTTNQQQLSSSIIKENESKENQNNEN